MKTTSPSDLLTLAALLISDARNIQAEVERAANAAIRRGEDVTKGPGVRAISKAARR
jgi:hypothetical protein